MKQFPNSIMKNKKTVTYIIIGMLAAMVIFVTAYAQMAPGITAEKELDQNLKIHQHTKECYDENKELVCGYADYVVHTHDARCYNEDGIFICPLKEVKEHVHDASCYKDVEALVCKQEEQASHHHEQTCYERQKGELQCTIEEHEHIDECYQWDEVLVCGQEETEGHSHTAECYKHDQVLACEKPEIVLHTHTEKCYDHGKLICNKLEVQEHQHTESCFLQERNKVEDTNKSDKQKQSTPMDIEKNKLIGSSKVSYKDKNTNKWIEITDETKDIPGDATVLLQINYHGVDIQKLKNAGLQLTYQLPALLKEPEVSGDLKANGKNIGTIRTDGKQVVLTFFSEWIQEQEDKEMHEISGEFYVESQFDGSQIEGDGPGKLVIGGVTVTINFEKDVAAKHGRVTVKKKAPVLEEKQDGLYLKYSLEVQVPAGAADVPDVKVVDHFKENKQYVESYIGVEGTEKETNAEGSTEENGPIEIIPEGKIRGKVYLGNETSDNQIPNPAVDKLVKPGILVWNIGKMTAEESRTLTYTVKLKDHYRPSNVNGNNQHITNDASVYSKTYFRGNSEQNYTPNIRVDIVKTAGEFIRNEQDDGGKISYQVQIYADQKNSYTVQNVKITDFFPTEKYNPYLDYEKATFQLYKGKGISGEKIQLEQVKPSGKEDNPIIKTENSSKKSFDLYIGELAPGDEKTLIYTVSVKPGIWTVDNGAIQIGNTAAAYSDDSQEGGNKKYKDSHVDKMLDEKTWSRKVTGELVKQEKTVTIPKSDKVYVSNGNAFVEEQPTQRQFHVPAYSQEYQVLVNEEGRWDFSKAEFKDTLKHEQMVHSGYLKLEVYEVKKAVSERKSDSEAIASVKNGTIKETIWLNIDQQQSFSFKPSDFKLHGPNAYLLTYYSTMKNPEEQYQVHVSNKFEIKGNVIGPNGSTVTIPGISVDKDVEIQGENHYSSEKLAWYYEKPSHVPKPQWKNGELYWAIKVTGNQTPSSLKIKDTASSSSHKMVKEESLVGIYKGYLPEGKNLTDYKTIEEFKAVSNMEQLEGIYSDQENLTKDYRWEIREDSANNYLFIEFSKAIQLEENKGQAIYAIIKTTPTELPEGKRDSQVYTNSFDTYNKISGQWVAGNNATLTVRKSQQIFKETQGAFTFDGTKWETLKAGAHTTADNLAKELIQKPGTYIEWLIHINWDGTMEGLAEIEDQLPKGVELTYVRLYWMADYYQQAGQKKPETPQIQELENNQEWEKKESTYRPQGTQSDEKNCISYYNRRTGKVRWNIDSLQSGGDNIDERAVEFQLVCRVTDKDALLSGKDVTKNNSIAVTYQGKVLSDSDQISFKRKTLFKKTTYDKNNGGNYPFEIELNPLGEDLVAGADYLTVVDELSNTLTIAPETIRVVDQTTQKDVTASCTVTIDKKADKQILRITVPDSMKLKITYTTYVNAKPGETIAISNIAHWEGYEVSDEGSVIVPDFSYTAGGSAGGDAKPSLKVFKLDKEDLNKKLPGATFSVQKITKQSDGTWKLEGEKYENMTNQDGVAMFSYGMQEKRWMEFDTIYCLKEEQAPQGYVQDLIPYYFAIMKNKTLDEIASGFSGEIHPWYQNAQYVYSAYNHKGEIKVEKTFCKEDKTPLKNPSNGSFRFGLFKEKEANEKPLQILTITYNHDAITYQRDGKEVSGPIFTQLEVDPLIKYYVFELDEQGQPMKEGQLATINGKTFEVTYNGNGNSIDQSIDGKEIVQVTNVSKQFILPETGGKGRAAYPLIGAMLLLSTSFWYFYHKQKIRRIKK